MIDPKTPIIIGVGEAVEHLSDPIENASSAHALAAKAAEAALFDTAANCDLASEIDVVVATRTFPDSSPLSPNPFGTTNNMPRSIATRIGADPRRAIYSKVGGNGPQKMVNYWSEQLAAGEASVVLLAGAEAIASVKAAMKAKATLQWKETIEGDLENQGLGLQGLFSISAMKHQLLGAIAPYAVCEMARKSNQGQSIEDYTNDMAQLLAPFSEVAAKNPYSMFPQSLSAEDIATPSERNGYVAYPYTKAMVAKDGVNQAAAVILTTVEKAKELGVDESKWVFLHAYSDSEDKSLLERENLGKSPALTAAYQQVLEVSGLKGDDIEYIDIYSCFPIVVAEAKAALGISDPEKVLTQTGGLPFFGGPGNNYSMHGIASVVRALRESPNEFGLVGANGGVMDKHSVGLYSCRPNWRQCDSSEVQEMLDANPSVVESTSPEGWATIESYTVQYSRGVPQLSVVIGRTETSGERFVANNFPEDQAFIQALLTTDMVGHRVAVTSTGKGNRVALNRSSLLSLMPAKPKTFRDNYEYCTIVRNGHILEVTIDRADVMNCLHPYANDELEEIFDLYEADDTLWIAILTGAGNKAFCAGNDLKYSASGKAMWVPKTGFAGVTSRRRKKPLIAAVNGVAMGGGMEIALASDVVIASDRSAFSLPEVKVGLIAGAGGIQRLTRQIPLKQAMDILITGRSISSTEAKEMGFVNEVVPSDELMNRAREYAAQVCENSPTSIQLTLQLLAETNAQSSIDDAVQGMPKTLDDLFTSEDFMEGPRAFAEKRKPKWTGR